MHDLAVGPAQRGQRVAATEKIGDLWVDVGFFLSLVRQQLLLQQPIELAQLGPDAFAPLSVQPLGRCPDSIKQVLQLSMLQAHALRGHLGQRRSPRRRHCRARAAR